MNFHSFLIAVNKKVLYNGKVFIRCVANSEMCRISAYQLANTIFWVMAFFYR